MSIKDGTFKKAYFEITNVCNANCSFCPKTKRSARFVSFEEFSSVCNKLSGRVEYLYFHLMGEPLLHPEINLFSRYATENGFKVMLTTNGILADKIGIPLISEGNVYKVSVSLHSYEANSFPIDLDTYIARCISLADACRDNKTVCALRLWNLGSLPELNDVIINALTDHYGEPTPNRTGYKLSEYVFLEWGDRFDWPIQQRAGSAQPVFCHGLRNQIGILSDGTVVPCCLDSEGTISLGNIFSESLDCILSSSRANELYDSFTLRSPCEELCKGCGFATRFK